MPSKDLSTEPITSAQHATSTSIPRSAGPSPPASPGSAGGSISTLGSETGISEWNTLLAKPVLFAISSAIESYILTDLIPFLLKQSPGDLKVLSQKYVLEARFGSEIPARGPSCSYRFTIALYSKSLHIGRDRALLSISLEDLSKLLSRTQIPSSSNGESPSPTQAGETANDGGQ